MLCWLVGVRVRVVLCWLLRAVYLSVTHARTHTQSFSSLLLEMWPYKFCFSHLQRVAVNAPKEPFRKLLHGKHKDTKM